MPLWGTGALTCDRENKERQGRAFFVGFCRLFIHSAAEAAEDCKGRRGPSSRLGRWATCAPSTSSEPTRTELNNLRALRLAFPRRRCAVAEAALD
eukprot:CAMPEP_0172647552 /NCGR_PEP_ID=MMETSP1068-20121228/240808_1 /TAXON_ID=35684 /ORGANISM="Pseudopedinella elastica, Strain CCMP716" /LENGTH=94 /DNA_ID=CAMNT_0013461833 /DNA_START=474 /DNA_END=758 /DNA_ORIENTATION=-